jgi:hypothetical protein
VRFVLIGAVAAGVLVGISRANDNAGLAPDAIDYVISNRCLPDGHQEFTYMQVNGKRHTLSFDKCLIKK